MFRFDHYDMMIHDNVNHTCPANAHSKSTFHVFAIGISKFCPMWQAAWPGESFAGVTRCVKVLSSGSAGRQLPGELLNRSLGAEHHKRRLQPDPH